jgi:hypothetical protein
LLGQRFNEGLGLGVELLDHVLAERSRWHLSLKPLLVESGFIMRGDRGEPKGV